MAGITGVPHVIPHRIHINGGAAAEIQARIRGATGQTANILEVQNSAGTTLFSVDNDGDVSISGNLDAVVNETLTGNITLSGNLTVNGNTTIGNALTDTFTINATPTFLTAIALTTALTSTNNATFSGFVSSTVLNLPRRGATPATMGSTGRIYTFAGDVDTTELWYRDAAGNDVQITDAGALEGASLFWDDDEYIRMGNTAASPDVRMGWNTAQTVDAWYFGTATGQNTVIFAEDGDRAFDFAHGAQTNPTVFIHSAAQSTTQWLELFHNQTNGVIVTGTGSLVLQNTTVLPAAELISVDVTPTYSAENFNKTGLRVFITQNGTNTQTLRGMIIAATKGTGGTTVADLQYLTIATPAVTGTITDVRGIVINDISTALGTTSYGIRILSQTANATTTRAIELVGTGVSNAVRFGSSANAYSNAAQNIRFSDSTNANGLDFNLLSTAIQTINTVSTTTGSLRLQVQTMTPGAAHSAVALNTTWAAEDFSHGQLFLAPVQNGANSSSLLGLNISMTQAGVGTLASMAGVNINASTVGGTLTAGYGIDIGQLSIAGSTTSFAVRIQSQTANATTTRAIELVGTGVNNAIRLGASPNIYSSAAENIRFADSTNANGLDFNLLSTAVQTIRTVSATSGSLALQLNTFTAGASHNAVLVAPTWATENFSHSALVVSATQNGANSVELFGVNVNMVQAGAGTLASMIGVRVAGVSVVGAVTAGRGIEIENQSAAGGSTAYALSILSQTVQAGVTTRAINIAGNGVTNSIRFNGSPNLFSNAANNIRLVDATNANGIDFNLLATANQTINTVTATTGTIILQGQTFTSGATHSAVQINPTWTSADNFIHTGLIITATQAGANSTSLRGLTIANIKTTAGGTVLDTSAGLIIAAPDITGTLTTALGLDLENHSITGGTTAFAIRIQSQSANATTTRAIEIAGTGITNAIRLGASPNIYSSAAQIIRFSDSTDARNIVFTLTAAGAQTIGTSAGNLTLSPASANVATAANVDVDMSAGGRIFGGGVQINSQTLAGNTNLTMDENDGHIDITSGAVSNNTITLPVASGNQGMIVSFYLEVDGGFDAVITRAGADVIQNGAADLANTTVTLDTAGEYLMLQCISSTMWQVVVNNGGVVA